MDGYMLASSERDGEHDEYAEGTDVCGSAA